MDLGEAFEKEENALEDQLDNGEITTAEFNKEMREMRRSFREEAEESAHRAYDDEMGRW